MDSRAFSGNPQLVVTLHPSPRTINNNNKTYLENVARVERSVTRDRTSPEPFPPGYAALHPGYILISHDFYPPQLNNYQIIPTI